MYRAILFIVMGFALLVQTGCVLLIVPLEYAFNAAEGEKDVSREFARGHVMGKVYETLQDLYLTQFNDSYLLCLEKTPTQFFHFDKNGVKVEDNVHSLIVPIAKGTRFKICRVQVKTSFGHELCDQRIYAELVNEKEELIPSKNSQEWRTLILVSYLFENTDETSDENWIFRPRSELIKEIPALSPHSDHVPLHYSECGQRL